MLAEWTNHKFVNTDGSKSNVVVSCAIYEPSSNLVVGFIIYKHASVFTAEVEAVLSALKHIQQKNSH